MASGESHHHHSPFDQRQHHHQQQQHQHQHQHQQQVPASGGIMNHSAGHAVTRFTLDTDYIDELASDLESRYWENKPPENWTSEDVWHWIFSWAGDRSVDVEEVQPLAYSNMTGQQLCSMSRNDFVNLNPKYGGHIYETLQQLSNQFREFRKSYTTRFVSANDLPLFYILFFSQIHSFPIRLEPIDIRMSHKTFRSLLQQQ